MEHQQGQHVHATAGAEGYGNPVPEHGTTTQMDPTAAAAEEHRSRGILHRSGSSSSSSSSSDEDDGMGGRRKKGLKDKIKEKLPGNKNKGTQGTAPPAAAYGQQQGHHATAAGTTTTTGQGEKKGLMDKIKDKLPGHN